ncbi:MAG TPA: alpha/beta hydrolase [Pyrinomonadaceae bacterium]|nr:alpha/beta hydrolase [Pyrinomonadaceae bacterium]
MKRFATISTLTFLLALTCIAQPSIEGEWVGGSNLFGDQVFIQVSFERTGTTIAGNFNCLAWRAARRPFSEVRFESSQLHFEFPSTTGVPFVGDARLENGVIRGTIKRGNEQGAFHLVPVARVNPRLSDSYVGTYQVEPNKFRLITWGASGHLRLVDPDSGGSVALFPSSETTYFFGANVIGSTTAQQTVSFTRNDSGSVTSLIFRQPNSPDLTLAKVERYRQEQVRFHNGKVTLTGTLLLPSNSGRHPAIIFHEGSGDWTRDDTWFSRPVDLFLKHGIAVLLYDKRGVGNSTGDWHTSSYTDLAGDLLAGVRLLKSRRDINSRQIGVRGFSQGGWIASLAAARSRDVAFIVYISASGAGTIEEQDTETLLAGMSADAFSEVEIEAAREFVKLTYEAPHSREAWQRLQTALPNARNQKWFSRTIGGLPKDSWVWEQRRLNAGYDPALTFRRVRCPVLIVYGERDNPAKGIARIEQALTEAGNKDYTVRVFPGADHDLDTGQPGDGKMVWAEGFLELLTSWTLQRVTARGVELTTASGGVDR